MKHDEAARLSLVEKYLLDELPPELRDEFEEHYFDCLECADDLRATAAFLDTTKEELKKFPAETAAPGRVKKPWLAWLWTPAFVVPTLAACLLVIAYQSLVVYPHFRSEIAQLQAPEILPSVSLVGDNSRGGTTPSITVREAHAFLVSFDIPTQERFSSYTCLLYSPSGSLAWSVQVSAAAARDTVTIRIPATQGISGNYALAVKGDTGATPAENGVDLVRYHFTLKNQ